MRSQMQVKTPSLGMELEWTYIVGAYTVFHRGLPDIVLMKYFFRGYVVGLIPNAENEIYILF